MILPSAVLRRWPDDCQALPGGMWRLMPSTRACRRRIRTRRRPPHADRSGRAIRGSDAASTVHRKLRDANQAGEYAWSAASDPSVRAAATGLKSWTRYSAAALQRSDFE